MSIQSRVEKLEQAHPASESGMCECNVVGRRDLRSYTGDGDNYDAADADTRPPRRCDLCGLPMRIIKLICVTTETYRPEREKGN